MSCSLSKCNFRWMLRLHIKEDSCWWMGVGLVAGHRCAKVRENFNPFAAAPKITKSPSKICYNFQTNLPKFDLKIEKKICADCRLRL